MSNIPVHIITGFLGSGKTTFLNHLISQCKGDRILVVENECGSINIDGALVLDGIEDIVELSSGCLCCSLSEELIDVLHEVSSRRDQFDRIVIETTGIADPSSILQVFLEDAKVKAVFELQQVICLTDAQLIETWLGETEEALRQISMSDCILINKMDLISPVELQKVKHLVREINPCANVWVGSKGLFPIDEIFDLGTAKPKTMEIMVNKKLTDHEHVHEGGHQHTITTFSLRFPNPLDLDRLSVELNQMVNLYREQVYRIKGIIDVEGQAHRLIVQSVRSSFVITEGSPWEPNVSRVGTLVFIGRGLKKSAFEKRFFRHMKVI